MNISSKFAILGAPGGISQRGGICPPHFWDDSKKPTCGRANVDSYAKFLLPVVVAWKKIIHYYVILYIDGLNIRKCAKECILMYGMDIVKKYSFFL